MFYDLICRHLAGRTTLYVPIAAYANDQTWVPLPEPFDYLPPGKTGKAPCHTAEVDIHRVMIN
jgi:hypothetical protein